MITLDYPMKRLLLATSILINLCFVCFFVGKRVYYSNYQSFNSVLVNDSLVTYSYNKTLADQNTVRLFQMMPIHKGDIVFVGTSLTQGFPLQEMFRNTHLLNRGVGGNTTSDILKRFYEVANREPGKVFIEAGINDLTKGLSIDSVMKNVDSLVRICRIKNPKVKLYLHSILPTRGEQGKWNYQIVDFNKRMEQYCKDGGLTYIDTHSAFTKVSEMNPALTTDGIHLTAEGYKTWKGIIEKYINE